MPLAAATRLGTYEIIAPLGAGGMGEVYRAMDLRLGREIALKVLPAETSASAERLARFEREARTVAGLNHPNIVTLFSIETDGDVRYVSGFLIALAFLSIGDLDAAEPWIVRAADERSSWVNYMKVDPRVSALHERPRIKSILARLGRGA